MHSGNGSGIDRQRGCIVIKPSGMDYDKLPPSLLRVTDLNGQRLKAGNPGDDLNPSGDLPHQLYLYAHCAEIGGIIHTYSNYTTSFAPAGAANQPMFDRCGEGPSNTAKAMTTSTQSRRFSFCEANGFRALIFSASRLLTEPDA